MALPILILSARSGWVVIATPWPIYLQEIALVSIVQEVVWAPGPVWMGMVKRESLALIRVQIPNCLALASCCTDYTQHRCNLGQGENAPPPAPSVVFYLRIIFFFATELKRGK